jgi:protein-S-isoprenylcysteine O-methyltransferase Ste14
MSCLATAPDDAWPEFATAVAPNNFMGSNVAKMEDPELTTPVARPFDQRIRIAALRILFVICLPLLIFTKSAWAEQKWVFEILEVTGILLIITAVLGRFWAILYIGGNKNQTVMQDGPYSICRHPLYLFSTIGVIGFGLMLGTLVITALLGAAVFFILAATARREETFLRSKFGAEYDTYGARVPLILPNLSLFRTQPTVHVNIKTLRINFFDSLVFLVLIPIADLMEAIKEAGLVTAYPLY